MLYSIKNMKFDKTIDTAGESSVELGKIQLIYALIFFVPLLYTFLYSNEDKLIRYQTGVNGVIEGS